MTVFSMKTIEKLWICNNGMAAESVEYISTIISEGGYPPLNLFHFYNNMAGDGGAKAMAGIIKNLTGLVDFRFSATRAGSEGCLEIAKVYLFFICFYINCLFYVCFSI